MSETDWRSSEDMSADGTAFCTWETKAIHPDFPEMGSQPILIIGQGLNRIGLSKLNAHALAQALLKFAEK
jgi:hypothetical protein